MKCPKCGYTSFDYLDDCKNCGADVSDVRASLGVIAISPDELAAQSPAAMPEAAAMPEGDFTGGEDAFGGDIGGDIGGDLDTDLGSDLGDSVENSEFEQSFDTMVEHTSYDESDTDDFGNVDIGGDDAVAAADGGDGSPEFDKSEVEPEEEFLDLDFGGIFEDEDENS